MAARCRGGCDGREEAAVEALLQWQKVSDFLVGASYMSIPLELLHFATCADLAPLRWPLLQAGAFIVLCGLVHLLAVFAAYGRAPTSRRLLAAFTAAKALAALAAAAAAVSLPTFIPQLLRLKAREAMLRDKARQLDRDVSLVRRREETAARVVRAIMQHIRGDSGGGAAFPPDAHAVLRTAVLHLSDALGLRSCAVWMPSAAAGDGSGELHLVHQLPADDHHGITGQAIRVSDRDVAAVMASKNARVLRPGSPLGTTPSGAGHGAAAAIRMPMLRVSNFVDASSPGADEQAGAAVSYAIMVLVLPAPAPTPDNRRSSKNSGGGGARDWTRQELEIVEVVADQLAVALSHAAVLEEWQLTRYKLAERQRVVAQARHDAAAAARARDAAQSAVRDGVLRPMHAVVALLSVMQAQQQQDGALRGAEQRVAVGAMARASALSSTLVDDVMAALLAPATAAATTPGRGEPASSAGGSLARRPFDLRALVRDAAGVAACLARCRGLGFTARTEMGSLPADCWVVGDDRRVFHLLLHMLGAVLDRCGCHCHDLCFSVDAVVGDQDAAVPDHRDWVLPNLCGCNTVCVRFQLGITSGHLRDGLMRSSSPRPHDRNRNLLASSVSSEARLSIATCNKIVQMMNGRMWRESAADPGGQQGERMSLVLHFQLGFGVASPSSAAAAGTPTGGVYRVRGVFGGRSSSSSTTTTTPAAPPPEHHFNGLPVLLADTDGTSREVTRKLLERLGCQVLPVPSAAHCLGLLLGGAPAADQPPFQFPYFQLQVVLLDLHTPAAAGGGGGADAAPGAMDDGFEVALRIRELTGDSFGWLLILVALPLPPRASCVDVREVCQRTGVNGVVHKPITLPALGAQLYRVLHNET